MNADGAAQIGRGAVIYPHLHKLAGLHLGQRPVGIGESEQYIALVDMPHLHHPKVKNVFLHCFSLCFITYLTANIAFFFESLALRGGKA